MIIVDSTGLKVTNRGEWLRKKHEKERKGWIKLHIALDLKSKRVVAVEVTDERVKDLKKAKELVQKSKKKAEEKGKGISKVIADAGYDTHELFRYLGDEGIEPAVLVRKDAKIKDCPVSAFKRWFGEYVISNKFENVKKELLFKVGIINTLMMAGVV